MSDDNPAQDPSNRSRPSSLAGALGVVAAAVLVVVIALAVRQPDAPAPPSAPDPAPTGGAWPTSTPTSRPTGPLSPDNLPTTDDLAWDAPGDWAALDHTELGPGSVCLARGLEESPGALRGLRREYELRGRDDGRARVSIAEFRTPGEAAQAAESVAARLRACRGSLERAGATQVSELPERSVAVARGIKAIFVEYAYAPPAGTNPDIGTFDAQAVVASGSRLALVRMVVQQQENYWSFPGEPRSGHPLHPMYRSLPKVVDRLDR
ncbi:hypothetical protein [Naumannella huperziae]